MMQVGEEISKRERKSTREGKNKQERVGEWRAKERKCEREGDNAIKFGSILFQRDICSKSKFQTIILKNIHS